MTATDPVRHPRHPHAGGRHARAAADLRGSVTAVGGGKYALTYTPPRPGTLEVEVLLLPPAAAAAGGEGEVVGGRPFVVAVTPATQSVAAA